MSWSLKYPKISSSGHTLVLKLSYCSTTPLVILTRVQCDHHRRFIVIRLRKKPPWRLCYGPRTITPTVRYITFVLIVNVHLWNYYVPSRAYARETPFNHIDSTSSRPTFSCILAHNLTIIIYHFLREGRKTEQGERREELMSMLRSTTAPNPWNRSHHHLPLITCQGKLHAAPRHSASPRASGGKFPLCFAKYFPLALTFVFIHYCHDRIMRGGYLRGGGGWMRWVILQHGRGRERRDKDEDKDKD